MVYMHTCMLYISIKSSYLFSGKARHSIVFPRGRKSWIAKPILEAKDYIHLTHVMEDVIQFRLDDKAHDMIDYNTPSTIPCNIVTIERPPREDII